MHARNTDIKIHSDKISNGNEGHVIGNWRKSDLRCKVAKNLDTLCLCSSVFWKVELAGNENGYLGDEISKQSIEGAVWLLLTAYNKVQEKRG